MLKTLGSGPETLRSRGLTTGKGWCCRDVAVWGMMPRNKDEAMLIDWLPNSHGSDGDTTRSSLPRSYLDLNEMVRLTRRKRIPCNR
jgi:hypothetical protein